MVLGVEGLEGNQSSLEPEDPEEENQVPFTPQFVDASNDAYGAVSYLTCEYNQGYFTLNHCVKDESCPFKAHNYTATGIDDSNSEFEANLVNHRSPEHSDSRCTFVVKTLWMFYSGSVADEE